MVARQSYFRGGALGKPFFLEGFPDSLTVKWGHQYGRYLMVKSNACQVLGAGPGM